MSRFTYLFLAAQIAAGSGAFVSHAQLRTNPQKTETLTFSNHIWNNTITRFVQNDILLTETNPQPVDKLLYVIVCMFFGCCGCDRCFMGQTLLGVLKFATCGGLLIWHLVDYFVCVYCALSKMKSLNMVGYDVTFKPATIENAFWACIILLLYQMYTNSQQVRVHRAQMEQQQELLKAMNAAGQSQQQESLGVPMSHQCVAHVPTPFAKALRKAGVLNKHASVPELIKAFTDMDKDGDGQLDRDELKQALSSMGMGEDDIDAMVKEADQDGDGKISKDEFISYHAKREAAKAAKKEAEKAAKEEAEINPDVA